MISHKNLQAGRLRYRAEFLPYNFVYGQWKTNRGAFDDREFAISGGYQAQEFRAT